MRTRRRHTLAFLVSAGLHAAPLVWGAFSLVPDLDVPEIEFEFQEVELLDPDQLQAEAAVEQPEQVVMPPEPAPPEDAPEEEEDEGDEVEPREPEEPQAPQRDLGKRRTAVDKLAPEQSTFYAMLVPRRIRRLPFADAAMDIMTPLPDFQYLVVGGGFDPLRDFDHIVIATPDLRDATQTFLAVDTSLPRSEVKYALERAAKANGESIAWSERGTAEVGDPSRPGGVDDDPRLFVLLPEDIVVFVRPEFLPHLLRDDAAGELGEAKTAGGYVANLTRLRRFAARHPTAGLQVVAKNLRNSLRNARGLPFDFPDHLELLAEAQEAPELFIRVSFLTATDARQFVAWWKDELGQIIAKNLALRLYLGGLYGLIEIEQKGKTAELWGRFETEQAQLILESLADLSGKMTRRSPEEVEALEQRRRENLERRDGGRLPPSTLDAPADRAPNGPPANLPP